MKHEDHWAIEQVRGRLMTLYLVKYGLAALTVWAFLYGTAVLALRAATDLPRLSLVWGLASLPLALVPALLLAWKRMPDAARIRALLDKHSRCGGLLMAGAEQPLDEWQDELPELRLPTLSYHGRKSWGLFAAAAAFVALGFLVPQSLADLVGRKLNVDHEVEKLTHQIDVLKEEKVIGRIRAEALKDKLQQLRQDAKAKDPAKTLEALDHVQETANKSARDAAETAISKAEQMARAEAMTEALERISGKMDQAQLTDAMNELALLAKKAAAENELLEESIEPELMEAIKKGSLTKEQTKKLAKALKEGKLKLSNKMSRLMKAKLLDPSAMEKLDKASKCDCEGLAVFLKENGCKSDLCDAVANSEKPGRGGVNRGPGAAKLDFSDQTSEDGFKFKEEELPPAAVQALKDSQVSGVSRGSPNIGKEKAEAGASGALAGSKQGGGSASTQVVLPRHRGAVERYFDRPAKPKN